MSSFRKVLIANRGEIAVRIIRALRELDVPSVAVFSEADRRGSTFRWPTKLSRTVSLPRLKAIFRRAGYSKLPDRPARMLSTPVTVFLVKMLLSHELARKPGSNLSDRAGARLSKWVPKTAARQVAVAAGAPVVPGSEGALNDVRKAAREAARIGYPVLLKASAGGGGKGMRRVDSESELADAMRLAASEAERAFGSGEVYLERLIEWPRHIEIQVLGDEYGHLIHLGERECSIQRRHQKIVEECPSPLVLRCGATRAHRSGRSRKLPPQPATSTLECLIFSPIRRPIFTSSR